MPHFMHQGIQGKEVTFKDVLILFLKRFERILAVALAFAVVFAAFGGLRAYRSVSAENTQKLQDDYQLKLDEYNQSTEKLRITIEQQQQRLDSMQQYAEESIYYNLDAFNEAVSELVFYVDTGYQIVPSQYYQTPNKTGEIVSAYCDAYRSAQLYDGIRDILGDEVDIKYIDELLSVQRAGDIKIKDSVGNVTVRHSDGNQGVVLIRARAQDEQTASAITSFVFQYLRENLSSAIAEHSTTVISDSTMIVVDDELEALKRSTDEEMRQLQESIKTNQAQLANLEREMPQPPAVSKTAVFKKAILFGIIGGVLGGVIICLWVLLAYLADNRLDGAYQAAKLYNLELFAVVGTESKKRKPWFAGLIDRLEANASRQRFADSKQAAAYTDAAVRALLPKSSCTVAVVSSRKDAAAEQMMQQLTACTDDTVTYIACPAVLEDAASMRTAAESDAVLLVEQSGVSILSEINREIIRLEKAEKEIVGLVLSE